MTAPDLSTRVLSYLIEQPPHRWVALDVIARAIGCDEDRARHELRALVQAGLVIEHVLRSIYIATERARTHARQAASIEGRATAAPVAHPPPSAPACPLCNGNGRPGGWPCGACGDTGRAPPPSAGPPRGLDDPDGGRVPCNCGREGQGVNGFHYPGALGCAWEDEWRRRHAPSSIEPTDEHARAVMDADTRPGVPEAMRRALDGCEREARDARLIAAAATVHTPDYGAYEPGKAPPPEERERCGDHLLGDRPGCVPCRRAIYGGPLPCETTAPPPADADRRAQFRAEVLAWLATAPLDEQELLVDIALRIKRGRAQYGAWSAIDERRDLVQEEHEEHLDGLVYSSMRRVRARLTGAGGQ